MIIKNQRKFKSNVKLLQGGSLEEYNEFFRKLLSERGISGAIEFNLELLQQFINKEKSFGKGLVEYLKQLEKQLDQITDDKDLKMYMLQILSEMGSLVFPNTSACYSIIPNDLKELKWEELLQNFNDKIQHKNPDIVPLLSVFLTHNYPQSVVCLVALCLCDVLVHSLNKMNGLLVDEDGQYVEQKENLRPRLKASAWIDQLSWNIKMHLYGITHIEFTDNQKKLIQWYSHELAKKITETVLVGEELFASYKTIQAAPLKKNKIKTAAYFAWTGSNLLTFPKTLALPMVYPPNEWIVDEYGGANDGGYLLSSLTKISYQGYLDSKSSRTHNHRLYLKNISGLNNLQKVKFAVNENMVAFYNKYKKQLTESEELLLTDKWLNPDETVVLTLTKKWARIFNKADAISEAISNDLISKKNETLRNQETLRIAEMYCDKEIYWPAVQDFRGRIYRIGNLNIQLNQFVRSLITFASDEPLIKRRKQSNKSWAQYNLLIKEILLKDDLIEKWDNVFGDRLINNDTFENLLLEDFLAKKLSLIQVGQLLLVRQGAYARIGIYYDASASAYQIMGVINADKKLCQLTNVLKSENNKKEDLYQFFLNRLNIETQNYSASGEEDKQVKMYENYLKDNLNRSLIKAIVMPLIYGKTSMGFAEDLKEFFVKGDLYPKNSIRLKLASKIINVLKKDVFLTKSNIFMKTLRAFGQFLFDLDLYSIRGPYNNSNISYHKEEIQRIRLYFARKKGKYRSQQVSMSRIVRDSTGNPVKSKTKTINAFVANYIHFLDGVICHYIIKKLEQEGTFALGTVHDCFFIKPSKIEVLQRFYKEALVIAAITHYYNLLYWVFNIMRGVKKDKACEDAETSSFMQQLQEFIGSDFEYFLLEEKNICIKNLGTVDSEYLIEYLESFKSDIAPLNKKAYWNDIIEYFKMCRYENARIFMDEVLSDESASLFPDNE